MLSIEIIVFFNLRIIFHGMCQNELKHSQFLKHNVLEYKQVNIEEVSVSSSV